MTCPATDWSPARRRCGTATGCRSKKTAWTRRIVAFLHTLPGSEGFTDDFKELAEWDWMETPVGMVYIDTRRQDDKVWVRVADFILPNIHQFPPNADPMALRNSINRPQATTWAVPLDDTHTMQIGYYRAPEGQEFAPRRRLRPGWRADPTRSGSAFPATRTHR